MAHKFRTGDAQPSPWLIQAAVAALSIALLASGCGGAEGVAEGATVSVYVEAPLCAGARRELLAQGGRAGKLRVLAICLASVQRGARVDLATVGANARRATEDTSSIGYVSTLDPAAKNASQPILESVGVPQLSGPSGAAAMKQLLAALRRASGSSSLREAVQNNLMTR